jgi:ABC-type Fe3+-hydroxamate transport system substrate-binding protein
MSDPSATRAAIDDLGHEMVLPPRVTRVVSLVPSITEAVAATHPEALVGATDWCTHPAGLDVVRVRGTKNPDRAVVAALAPDLVIANQEENREIDVRRLRDAGLSVWVTRIESVSEALTSLDRLIAEGLGWDRPEWLTRVIDLWPDGEPPLRGRAVVPIWRDPWIVVGGRTFTGDLLRRLGWENVYAGSESRYPHVRLADLDAVGVDLAVLPDEPYLFTGGDGPESFSRVPTVLVPGRALTWYGPSLLTAREELIALLR